MKDAYVLFEPLNHIYKVLEAAHARGLTIIVVRSFPLCTAGPYAIDPSIVEQEIVIESWLDDEPILNKLAELSETYRFVGSYAAAEITLPFESKFRDIYELNGISHEQVMFLLDKEKVRNHLREKGLTSLKTISQEQAEGIQDWPADDEYFFKPVNGVGSAQVARIRTHAQLQQMIQGWQDKPEITLSILRQYLELNNRFYLEEAAKGELMSIEGFVVNGVYQPLGLSSRHLHEQNSAIEMGLGFPYEHQFMDKIIDKVTQIHQALNINCGPTHTEVMVDDNGEVELIELNIRFVGSDTILAINEVMGSKAEELILATTLGEETEFDCPYSQSKFAYVREIMPPLDLECLESMVFPPEAIFSKQKVANGSTLKGKRTQMDQIGTFMTVGASMAEAIAVSAEAMSKILVNGAPITLDANNSLSW
ncbi:acetyl-CoA carboxylase biotin carboxylase subunit family protein [Corallincola platygyrae]|uniref:Acetyl-CoA carboxylase biotin carboxylase subunit family protein n=1 Tax=Corallincola platygyrae TaxID=1193278 RepID=A0ABW4XJS4_9GAMM